MAKDRVRIDRWLWCVRIFKSRSKATAACKSGRVSIGEQTLKASTLVSPGSIVEVKKDGFNLQFLIKKLLERRVGAPIAVECYDNITPEAELNKFKDWFIGKAPNEKRERGTGRPTKKERRDIDAYKDEVYLDDWFD